MRSLRQAARANLKKVELAAGLKALCGAVTWGSIVVRNAVESTGDAPTITSEQYVCRSKEHLCCRNGRLGRGERLLNPLGSLGLGQLQGRVQLDVAARRTGLRQYRLRIGADCAGQHDLALRSHTA